MCLALSTYPSVRMVAREPDREETQANDVIRFNQEVPLDRRSTEVMRTSRE